MEVKAPDHSQMMVAQIPPSSSAIMSRINPDGAGSLFTSNSFMNTVLRPVDGHCPPQGPPEPNQSVVPHLAQGHPQHTPSQAGQHLGRHWTHRARTAFLTNTQASSDVQRISECPPFKSMVGGGVGHQLEVLRNRSPVEWTWRLNQWHPPREALKGSSSQQQGGFRMGLCPPGDGRSRGGYSGAHPGSQGVGLGGSGLPREQDGCHQIFMQNLLSPHLPEQTGPPALRAVLPAGQHHGVQLCGRQLRGRHAGQGLQPQRATEPEEPVHEAGGRGKGHLPVVSGNMHGGGSPGVRVAGLPHPPTPHGSSEPGSRSSLLLHRRHSRTPASVGQRSRHLGQDNQPSKLRPGERPRSGTLRPTNPFEPDGHLPLPSGSGVLLGRPQPGGEGRRGQHPRLLADPGPAARGGAEHPAPPSTRPTLRRPTPSLPSDIPLQYFSNQMFTSPGATRVAPRPSTTAFGSHPVAARPVGFGQASFPLLPEMPPMPISNSSGITPHLSNFSLTSLFPEIATAMPSDGSAMPMSPLLSLSNASAADSGKQTNRPAHNISHILGHDGSSAV
ncbi:hypothetical protein CRUP_028207 [Coryphaenoides rupestris]|nr:hypothetical protein CRUP_028207 [Coryphaenoides rupestris]